MLLPAIASCGHAGAPRSSADASVPTRTALAYALAEDGRDIAQRASTLAAIADKHADQLSAQDRRGVESLFADATAFRSDANQVYIESTTGEYRLSKGDVERRFVELRAQLTGLRRRADTAWRTLAAVEPAMRVPTPEPYEFDTFGADAPWAVSSASD